ncbi:hypothetical protein HHL17_26170 [Chitinophaga sp. G-6-1-13]|uniref:Insecticide toxin TcdB middle/N-terminal domain-containing protein n=1 Tax=Chitinophaga fulva TaxID=2728842 RepID=A0A848GT99_9BACT|nr:FG-GAP-like repeat-containing protein [Chitinophaga fulva]NML40711.1 hypothetical protein [Chitinophaga fulva]
MRLITFKCCCLVLLLFADIQIQAQFKPGKKTNNKQQQTTGSAFNGILQGKMSANPSGAATYSISLELPPGNVGATPSLQISYNSQSGNGLLGVGWAFSGFSSISRTGASVPQDGFRGGVNYDANDRFSLDGLRLMNNASQSGSYFSPGSTYYTELQQWKKIVANGNAGQGPTSFTVYLKTGAVASYGTGNGSQVMAQGAAFNNGNLQGSVSKWLVQKMTTPTGNAVEFFYTATPSNVQGQPMTGCAKDGTSYPDIIAYGITSSNTANRLVKFCYEPRPDTLLRFAGGSNGVMSVRLKAIRTYLATGKDTVPVKTYWLAYDSVSTQPVSQLVAITELGAYGAPAAPVTMQWTAGPNGFVNTPAAYNGPVQNAGFQGDFNGDGKTDLLPVSNNSITAIYYANGSGFTTHKLDTSINISAQTYVADYNGDGFPDLLVLKPGIANIYFCNSQTYVLNATPVTVTGIQFNSTCTTCVFTADLNGDAMADLLSVAGTTANVYLSNGHGFNPLQTVTNLKLAPGQIFVFDVNGDAQADLFTANQSGGTLYLSAFSQSRSFAAPITLPGMSLNSNPVNNLIADFNNDGLTDVLTYTAMTYNLYLSNGKGFAPAAPVSGMNLANATNWISDFNGDGTMDIYTLTGNTATLYYNYGGKFYPQPTTPPSLSTAYTWSGDFNGDGVADLFAANKSAIFFGGDAVNNTVHTNNQVPGLVTNINNGINGVYQFWYAPMTSAAVYQPGGNSNNLLDGLYLQNRYNTSVLSPLQAAAYPYVPTQSATYLLQGYTLSDGLGNTYPYQFKYSGSLTDVQAYGWLGFNAVQQTDSSAGNIRTTYYWQTFPLTGQTRYSTLGDFKGNLLQRTRNNYFKVADTLNTSPSVCYQVFNAASRLDHYDYGKFSYTIGTNYILDDFGNNILTEQLNDTAENNRLLTSTTYINNTNSWHIGFKTGQKMSTDTTAASLMQEQSWQYNQQTWQPTQSGMWLNSNNSWLYHQYGYDAYGNQILTVNAAGDTTLMGMDSAFHSFPVSQTSPPNQWGVKLVNRMKMDPANGKVTTATDANGNTLVTLYDQFGRDSIMAGPDSTGKMVVLSAFTYLQRSPAGYVEQRVVRNNWPGTAWDTSYVVYDGLSRTIQHQWQGISGQQVVQTKSYNSNNQLINYSLPYFQADNPQLTKISYDPYQRPVSVVVPGPQNAGVRNIIGYNNKTVTIIFAAGEQDSVVTHRSFDYYKGKRKVTQLIDGSGLKTMFAYDQLARVKQVTDPGGLVSTYSYYSTGDLLATTNPAAGNTQYLRNFTGNSFAVVQAGGDTIFCQMDGLQRKIAVNTARNSISYQYDLNSVKNGMTNLCKVVDPQARISHTYSFDAYHRVTNTLIGAGGKSFSEQSAFNPDGTLASLIYPDNSVANYSYYNNGYLQQVTFAEQAGASAVPYVTFQQYDAYGDQTQVLYGNQVQRAASFAPFGLVKNYTIQSPGGTLANKTYNWSNLFNISSITDNLTPVNNESFQYSDNGRLQQATVATGSLNYQYNPSGNLTLKDGITYTYNNYQVVNGTRDGQQVYSATYGPNGNMSAQTRYSNGKGVQLRYGYNAFNQLTAILSGQDTLSAYAYDYKGQRMLKSDFRTNSTELYVSPNYNTISNSAGSEGIRFITIPGQKIAAVSSSEGAMYLHGNFINSTQATTNSTGSTTSSMQYAPFGTLHSMSGQDTTDYLFSGMELDESGLYYFNARYYDPFTGRFITADDRLGGKPYQTDVYNRYAYTLNNPVRNYDPSGHVLGDDLLMGLFDVIIDVAELPDPVLEAFSLGEEAATQAVMDKGLDETMAEAWAATEGELGQEFSQGLLEAVGQRSISKEQALAMYKARRDIAMGMTQDDRLQNFTRRPRLPLFRGDQSLCGVDAYGNSVFVNGMKDYLEGEIAEREEAMQLGLRYWAQTNEDISEMISSGREGIKFTISFKDYSLKIGDDVLKHAAIEGEGDLVMSAGTVELKDGNLIIKNWSGHYAPTMQSLRVAEPLWRSLRRTSDLIFNQIIYKSYY